MNNIESNNTSLLMLCNRVKDLQDVRSGFPAADPTPKDLLHCLAAATDRFTANARKRRTTFNVREMQSDAAIIADCLAALSFEPATSNVCGAHA